MSAQTQGLRVLVVDDSPVIRLAVRGLLLVDPRIASVELAADGQVALQKLASFDADVVTLDVEMPGMDGLSALRQIMKRFPRPVIMLSSHTFVGAEKTIRALEWGAVDVVRKPGTATSLEEMGSELRDRVIAIAERRRHSPGIWRAWSRIPPSKPGPLPSPRSMPRAPSTLPAAVPLRELVAIGASTGGTEALHFLLSSLPADFRAPIVIVQHMPESFTGAFARRLDELCGIEVKEGSARDLLLPGRAIVARGNRHMVVVMEGACGLVSFRDFAKVNLQRPSIDVLFESVAALRQVRSIGVLLTGMGRDGAEGLLAMRRAGAATIAQDEASSIVYGMPKAAVDIGAAECVADLRAIPGLLQAALRAHDKQSSGQESAMPRRNEGRQP
jgi:two-component system, chemotaxis family, protein-glutamate methylesterase/glutaminase